MQEFRRTAKNTLRVETGAEQARLWLSPDVIDLGGKALDHRQWAEPHVRLDSRRSHAAR